tara:strand:+ start:1229 stop:1345 length:117 start_codon:yes stop_codon:yes gene_type:complete
MRRKSSIFPEIPMMYDALCPGAPDSGDEKPELPAGEPQ